jgi:hypothetical protein
MTRTACFAILTWSSLVNPTLAIPTPLSSSPHIDYNTLLDGSLGYLPSTWLVYRAALLELNEGEVERRAPTGTLLSAPAESSSHGRTSKENGAVMATFISGMLIPAAFQYKDNGPADGLCRALMFASGGMTSAIVSQEAAKDIYGNSNTNSQLEQGAIPGSFIGSVVGNGAGHALS